MTDTLTDKHMHGVWMSGDSFVNGDPPAMVGESTWDEVVESVSAEGSSIKDADDLFICTRESESWIPLAFYGPSTDTREDIGEKRIKKFMDKREAAGASDVIPETAPPAPEPEGEMVLRVTPHMASLLHEAFGLVSKGRRVTIELLPEQ